MVVGSNSREGCALKSKGKASTGVEKQVFVGSSLERASFLQKCFCLARVLEFSLFSMFLTGSNMGKPGNIDKNPKQSAPKLNFSYHKAKCLCLALEVFSKKLYYGSAVDYHVLSSFASRTRWHRPFLPIRVSTPSKCRLKVGSVHAEYKYRIL